MDVKVLKVAGFEPAIHGMRNPKNSWDRSDSFDCNSIGCAECVVFEPGSVCLHQGDYVVGDEDMKLMQALFAAGTEHRKYDRMLIVWMDITASHIFWQEFDTYKVGTVRNSCSKMHKIHVKPFVWDDFSHDGISEMDTWVKEVFDTTIDTLEWLREKFNETQEKKYWKALLEMLPMGFKLKATVMMSYEVAVNMINQRENHKWYEWHEFIPVLKGLPCMEEIRQKEQAKKKEDKALKDVLKDFKIKDAAHLEEVLTAMQKMLENQEDDGK